MLSNIIALFTILFAIINIAAAYEPLNHDLLHKDMRLDLNHNYNRKGYAGNRLHNHNKDEDCSNELRRKHVGVKDLHNKPALARNNARYGKRLGATKDEN